MSRRAQHGSIAHCPYCEASLPRVAAECPECRFPLTMAAADFGFRGPDHRGTTSTATPGGRSTVPVVPGGHPTAHGARVHGSPGHRMRITAWLLGLTSLLLLLAGVGALLTASSPGATSDREATAALLTALHRATDDPSYRQEVPVATLAADVPSASAGEASVDRAGDLWFAAAKSTSGRCFLLAGRLSDGVPLGRGTLGQDEPCTGAQVRLRSEAKLLKSKR